MATPNKDIYRITVHKFFDHNAQLKKGHKATLILNNLATHPKMLALPTSGRWLYVALLLLCGDTTEDTITVGHPQLKVYLGSGVGVVKALHQLERLQLVTFEKIDSFIREKKRREKKVIEEKVTGEQVAAPAASENSKLPLLAELWNLHCGNLSKVIGTTPKRDKKAAERFKEATEGEWVGCIQKIAALPFMNGENDRGWKATFDFLLKPDTRLAVLEGKYDWGKKKKFSNERNQDSNDELATLNAGIHGAS
jgi:hypothetical protein